MADKKGYYATLGLSPTATADEIKASYRGLAKRFHPDSGTVTDGGARFRKITEAYEALINPERRAAYDSDERDRKPEQKPHSRFDPLRCVKCNQITAQPRHLTFWTVVSVIFTTFKNPTQGIFCSRCARFERLKSSWVSGIVGWWGVPWGPIWTITEGLKSAFGGEHDPQTEERLLWHNALAFAEVGNATISFGLAERLFSSNDVDIRNGAKKLSEFWLNNGHVPRGRLNCPWSFDVLSTFGGLTGIAVIPAIGLAAFVMSGSKQTSPSTVDPSYVYNSPASLAPPPSSEIRSGEPTVSAEPTPTACKTPPINGRVLVGSKRLLAKGHSLTIDNGSGGAAIVKLRAAETGKVLAAFYTEDSKQGTISGSPDGRYRIQYALGNTLAKDCKSFNEVRSMGEFPDIENLETTRDTDAFGTTTHRMRISYTLYPVVSGNVRPTTISAAEFNTE